MHLQITLFKDLREVKKFGGLDCMGVAIGQKDIERRAYNKLIEKQVNTSPYPECTYSFFVSDGSFG